MNKFIQSLENVSNEKETENGAYAYKSTLNNMLDLFGTIGSMRMSSDKDIINNFIKAYADDNLLALKLLFYARDCRGGLGERRTFQIIANWLADNHPEAMSENLKLIPFYGRFDDLYCFVGTKLEKEAFDVLKNVFESDLENMKNNKPITNCAKWLKSCNTSSKESRNLGRLTAKYFGLSEKSYRKKLSMLRRYSNVVEVSMVAREWGDINYSAVPSYAAKNYKDAFLRHDKERYTEYLKNVANPESSAKINASTLFPYDLVREYNYGRYNFTASINETIEAQWKALPNYIGTDRKFLIMADVSGSMTCNNGLPMDTSISLAIYFAERNKGEFHGKFMTFSSEPKFVSLQDNLSLAEKILIAMNSEWGGSTNLESAFNTVLEAAIRGNCSNEDMPEAFVVITDMEIDTFGNDENISSFTNEMKKRFEKAGYKMPTIVWWNVAARQNTFHATKNDDVRFVSGSSAAVFKGLCEHLGSTPNELMMEVLNDQRYSDIKISPFN